MKKKSSSIRLKASLCMGLAVVAQAAIAQEYPNQPVTLVTPFSTGGDADMAARALGASAQKYLGKPIVILNKGGANGAIGSQQVKESRPDGYTLLLARVGSQVILPALQPTLSYKWNDFTFLGLLELNPVVCAVNKNSKIQDFAGLVEQIKKEPGKLNYATSGPATVLNLGPQMLFSELGLSAEAAVPISYKGAGDAVMGVLSGDVDFICTNVAPISALIKSDRLRGLITTTPERLTEFPSIPTAKETGYPQLEVIIGWSGLYGPPGMEKKLVDMWAKTLQQVSKDKAWVQATTGAGSIPAIKSPSETSKYTADQFAAYDKLGKTLGIQLK
ncbi:MAG TPA: tripartite tricarboxylate transporter substrate binding protein [Eoetvoesiella sp.]